MIIDFDEKGKNFLEVKKIDDKVVIILSSADNKNINSTLISSVEISIEQMKDIIKELGI